MSSTDDRLAEQLAHYRARAGEYEDWYLRRGMFDRGAEENERWLRELREVELALEDTLPAGGDALELACGTGWWTSRLLAGARRLVAVDGAPEMLALNAENVPDERVERIQADLFEWAPPGLFDFVFVGFWLSHVPAERFDGFCEMAGRACRPSGEVFFADNLQVAGKSAHTDHRDRQVRQLRDGSEHRVIKIYYEPQDLTERLAQLGWESSNRSTETHFLYGTARRHVRAT